MKKYHSRHGNEIATGVPFELDGIAYPWNWLDLASSSDLSDRGITVIEWGGDWSSPDAPAWPPAASAANYPEGFIASGSTGQRWQVRNKQWVRKLPDGISCDVIRQAVAEHGRFKSIRWARAQGYTWAQIAEARKCLR